MVNKKHFKRLRQWGKIYLGSQDSSELQLASVQEIFGDDYSWTGLWLDVNSSVNVPQLCICAEIWLLI